MADNIQDIYYDKQESYYGHARIELLPYIPISVKKVLDIGCGAGNFGQTIKNNFDCDVWGIEPNTEAASIASKKIDIVINNTFTNNLPELVGQQFDVVFFNDVLEHLVDPEEALCICKKLLINDGLIIASIPNVRWYPVILSLLRRKDFKYELQGVMDKTHLRFFTHKSMNRLFENSGYKVITIEGINKSNNFKYFNMLNFLLFNTQADMKFPQFIVVAQKT